MFTLLDPNNETTANSKLWQCERVQASNGTHNKITYVCYYKKQAFYLPPVASNLNSKAALAMRPSCPLGAPTSLAGQQSHSCRQSEGHMVRTMRWEFDLYTAAW